MSYAIVFTVLGTWLVVLGGRQGGVAYALCWLGGCFVLTGLAHVVGSGRLYGKRADGTLPFWSRALFAPFLLYTHGVWHLMCSLSREHAVDRVASAGGALILGRRLLASEAELPAGAASAHTAATGDASEALANWVDLTAEFSEPGPCRRHPGYLALPILDGGVPSEAELRAALAALRPGATYIHCAQGHGRTGLFAVALLAHRGEIQDMDDGLARLQAARPALRLNARQKGFLQRYLATNSAV